MSKYDEDCEEDQRNFFDVFVQALEGADRVIIETRNALGDFDAHYMTAPKLLTKIKELKAQIAGLLRIVGDKHDALCRIEELEAQLEWQPIETAPDNTIVIVSLLNTNIGERRNSFLKKYTDVGETWWATTDDGSAVHPNWEPTHWRHDIDPPKEQPNE